MPRRKPCPHTLSLFDDMDLPVPHTEFDKESVKAATIKGKWAMAISQALKDYAMSREEVAEKMSLYLGEEVKASMLNAYASQGRDTHIINLSRLEALIYVTQDRRLINLLADILDCRAVPNAYARHMNYAHLKEIEKTAKKQIRAYEREFLNDE